jgi:4-amino-4-deoxy-L-arabinose transferase-like glycosyltransferase
MLAWLTPVRCRLIFAAVLLLTFANQWRFLTHNCPIDLSGDEAQYWDWSRHLDLSYYSKGPLIAYLIRASCSVLGNNMPGVRFPALLLAVGTSICIYWITLKLFASDRLALGAFLLGGAVPMYAAGSALMTIDPPFFFFWALATCFAVKAILDGSRWGWIVSGVVVGLGFLTKYAMFLWLPFVFLFLLMDRKSISWLRTIWPWMMVAVAMAFTTPVIVWNAQHHWASLKHVATQTGANGSGGLSRGNLLEFVGAQVAIINPAIAVLIAGAVVYTLGSWSREDVHRRQLKYLLYLGLPFLVISFVDSFLAKVQPNWPAPGYFTLLILTAYFVSTRLQTRQQWLPWRGWFYGAIIFGLIIQPVVRGSMTLYPLAGWINRTFPRKLGDRPRVVPSNFDVVFKLRGIADPFAKTVSADLAQLPAGSFILCEDYQDASQLAFYVEGQPKTYFVGSYWTDPMVRRRRTQFDMWPDRQLDRSELIGKDAIYIGTMAYAPLRQSFEKIEALPDVVIQRQGLRIRSIQVWRCSGFKGIHRPDGEGTY